jgi:hypothetical protein
MSDRQDQSVRSREGLVPPGRVQVRDVPENARQYKWKPGISGNPSGRGGLYHEARRLAASASPTAMKRLIELMETAEDERVAFMACTAILDRAGVKPKEYDPREEQQAFAGMSLEERKARLRELIGQADQLLTRSSIHAAARGKSG